MRVYLRKVESTQGGNWRAREWSAFMACRGFGAVVETARMTREVALNINFG